MQSGDTDRLRKRSKQKEGTVRIDSSVVDMESARKYSSVTTRTLKASSVRIGNEVTGGLGNLFGDLLSTEGNDKQTGDGGKDTANLEDITTHYRNITNTGRVAGNRDEKDALFTIRQRCMRFLMELIFGWRKDRGAEDFLTENLRQESQTQVYRVNTLTNEYYHKEEETTTFSTTGLVKTADGRELPFHLEFGMSRRFVEYYEEKYETVSSYCDPLVINLDTNIAQVSDQKFFFDLDQDGKEEEISTLKKGSGFLALDLNDDGVINDGGELFGTKSGDGFKDLSKYDSDGNGWIDEADEIWEKLLIWTKDDKGNDKLYHLADLGVGAIGLSKISTQFALNSKQDNHNNAMIRSTAIFLYESGTVSTVQHLDLARAT